MTPFLQWINCKEKKGRSNPWTSVPVVWNALPCISSWWTHIYLSLKNFFLPVLLRWNWHTTSWNDYYGKFSEHPSVHILGWPKSSFGFSIPLCRKTRMNFLANPTDATLKKQRKYTFFSLWWELSGFTLLTFIYNI